MLFLKPPNRCIYLLHIFKMFTIRLLSGKKKEVDTLPDGIFFHKGRKPNLEKLQDGDWLVEVPNTKCAWHYLGDV